MRFIFFLLVALIFTACGHNKIRFSKVDRSQKVVEISEIPSLKKKSETTANQHPNNQTQGESERTLSLSSTTEEDVYNQREAARELNVESLNESLTHLPEAVEDSTTISREEAVQIKEEALRAERDGTLSLIFGSLFYLVGLIGIIVLIIAAFSGGEAVFIIATIALGIFSLVSLILSMVLGIKSLRAAYNTPQGKRRAIVGVVLSGIAIGLILINLLFGLL